MGQYQQWLQYRQNERHIKAQLEELAEELAQLHQREQELRQILQPPASPVEGNVTALVLQNTLVQALALTINSLNNPHHSNGHSSFSAISSEHKSGIAQMPDQTPASPASSGQTSGANAAISPALYNQSQLADNMELEPYPDDAVSSNDTFQPLLNRNSNLPPIPHSDPMLPEDMGAFLDEHTETEPQVALPWWIRNAGVLNPNGPVDQESARTNRLVQRWIERWGRHPIPPAQPQPPENGGKASS